MIEDNKEYEVDKNKVSLILLVWVLIFISLVLASNGYILLSLLSMFVSARLESRLRGAIAIYREKKR